MTRAAGIQPIRGPGECSVDADAVEAELIGIFELVEIPVVELRALLRIIVGCSAA